jgi:hypothetical protein
MVSNTHHLWSRKIRVASTLILLEFPEYKSDSDRDPKLAWRIFPSSPTRNITYCQKQLDAMVNKNDWLEYLLLPFSIGMLPNMMTIIQFMAETVLRYIPGHRLAYCTRLSNFQEL